MSRGDFSYDPQDALDTRKTPTRAPSRQSRSTPPDARDVVPGNVGAVCQACRRPSTTKESPAEGA